jgi:phosphate transport system permease protein
MSPAGGDLVTDHRNARRRDRGDGRVPSRAKVLQRLRLGDAMFRSLDAHRCHPVLVLLGGVIFSLVVGSLPAFGPIGLRLRHHGGVEPGDREVRRAGSGLRHARHLAIAMLIAVPVGLMVAFFLTELCPDVAATPIGIAIELLAGIPSIIYGIWGLFVFAPVPAADRAAASDRCSANVPVLSSLFAGPALRHRHPDRRLILAIMVLPFITSISRDVFDAVPPVLKEAAYGVGCTTWEVFRSVVLPYTRVGVIGGVMLGLGRALGETMAVTFVIGNAHKISAVDPASGHDHLRLDRQRVHRGRRRSLHLLADRARPPPVRHHFRRACNRALHADAHRAPDRVAHGRRNRSNKLYAGAGAATADDWSRLLPRPVRRGLARSDPRRAAVGRLQRPVAAGVHADDAAPGRPAACSTRLSAVSC